MTHADSRQVSIVFAPDNNYAKYLCVTLQSLIAHISDNRHYNITILNDNLTKSNCLAISQVLEGKSNVACRFVNIRALLSDEESSKFYKSQVDHISDAAYFRFFIPNILKEESKVVYLDSDLVIETDIADLYDLNMGTCWLAGIRDLGIESWPALKKHIVGKLGLETKNYINSGILLMNLDQFRTNNLTQACLDKLEKLGNPMCHDQDVLNCVCNGHILYLPYNWNTLWNLKNNESQLKSLVDKDEFDAFLKQTAQPDIIHFATSIKPWKRPDLILADRFWHYARLTPVYERIIYANLQPSQINRSPDQTLTLGQIINYRKYKRRYYLYKLLAFLAPVSAWRKKFRAKKRRLKNQLRATKAILRQHRLTLHS